MRFRAVVDCREGQQLVPGPAWVPRFLPTTISVCSTWDEAHVLAWQICNQSPRDCRNPRVEED